MVVLENLDQFEHTVYRSKVLVAYDQDDILGLPNLLHKSLNLALIAQNVLVPNYRQALFLELHFDAFD